jgi:uncharacterized coiled-coil protein SlyX
VATCKKVARPHFVEKKFETFLVRSGENSKDTTLSKNQSHTAFVEEQRKVQEQGSTIELLKSAGAKQAAAIAKQQKQIEALAAGLQKVSAEIELNNPVPRTVLNDQ